MASALLHRKIATRSDAASWRIDSAGVWTQGGDSAAEKAQTVLKKYWGLDLSSYHSQCVSRELLSQFDLILVMEHGHKEALRAEFPQLVERIFLLYEMVGTNEEIRDPYGGTMADYQATARELDQILTKGIERIIRLSGTP